ncbi:prephenate dehydrogenase [Mesotoga sp. Brook.08.105.5.1]|uniref:Prephenate dehydrogenase n=1 Tax=Mesotoga prima TaxID=1184387 RepID=A0A101HNU9_9BACT|nr:prephenate dehydrogenase [Mesotoga sp. Brook.08.105.5.1]KUK80356.1 MAG: Prephenate dehydrogenase [Mesotoga prima]
MKIQIIGAGSIGGSIAIRLSKCGHEVSVFDESIGTTEALKRKHRDISISLKICESADLTILAVPMSSEAQLLQSVAFEETVLDVASVMQPFQLIARKRKIRFISGHPMAGNEHKGPAGWDESMFDGRVFLLSPAEFASAEDLKSVLEIIGDLRSSPEYLSPERHDLIVSRVSQAAYFLSRALLNLGSDFEKYTGPGYASTSRLGRQNRDMVIDMARFNGKNIASSLEEAEIYLRKIRVAIENEDLNELEELISE